MDHRNKSTESFLQFQRQISRYNRSAVRRELVNSTRVGAFYCVHAPIRKVCSEPSTMSD